MQIHALLAEVRLTTLMHHFLKKPEVLSSPRRRRFSLSTFLVLACFFPDFLFDFIFHCRVETLIVMIEYSLLF